MERSDFFKTLLGGGVALTIAPRLLKDSEKKIQGPDCRDSGGKIEKLIFERNDQLRPSKFYCSDGASFERFTSAEVAGFQKEFSKLGTWK